MEWLRLLNKKEILVPAISVFLFLTCLYQLWRYHRAEWKYAAKYRLRNALFLLVLSLFVMGSVFLMPKENLPQHLDTIPIYENEPWAVINDDEPFFSKEEKDAEVYEHYGEQDSLGRCTAAMAMLGPELLPSQERGEIREIIPSGWQSVRYEGLVEDDWLYHRCHLIAYELSGENANAGNLITGTQYMNMEGMRPLENQVSAYIHRTGNHVLYRATPVYEGSELVARGVLIEAVSIEDGGEGIMLNRFCFNVQPGIIIRYSDGSSRRQ